MKNSIKILAAVCCMTAFTSSATLRAQDTGRNGSRQAALVEKLNLSEDQKTAFAEIQEKYTAQISELRGQGRSSGNREKIQALNTQKDAELKELLTEEQFETYAASKKRGGRLSGARSRN